MCKTVLTDILLIFSCTVECSLCSKLGKVRQTPIFVCFRVQRRPYRHSQAEMLPSHFYAERGWTQKKRSFKDKEGYQHSRCQSRNLREMELVKGSAHAIWDGMGWDILWVLVSRGMTQSLFGHTHILFYFHFSVACSKPQNIYHQRGTVCFR